MNIIQFWLIDSIVKASAHGSVALPTDSPRPSDDPAAEPLFRGSTDDEDDDDTRPHDIENPPLPRSRSQSKDSRAPSAPDENKSSLGASSTPTASGSGAVTPKILDSDSLTASTHAYPPSLASTSTSPASSRQSSVSPPKRRRSPPPPLALQPIHHSIHDGLPQVDTSVSDAHPVEDVVHDEKEWAAWDEQDDWVDHVGEDDWTGKRIEARKDAVHNVWTSDEPSQPVREST